MMNTMNTSTRKDQSTSQTMRVWELCVLVVLTQSIRSDNRLDLNERLLATESYISDLRWLYLCLPHTNRFLLVSIFPGNLRNFRTDTYTDFLVKKQRLCYTLLGLRLRFVSTYI